MTSPFQHIRLALQLWKKGSRVEYPCRNAGAASRIIFGRNVCIKKHAWFSVQPGCRVSIGDNTRVGRYFVLSGSGSSIDIGADVLISERVFITESHHNFEDTSQPVLAQGVSSKGAVRIGDGSWLGIGVCVMPGVTIGTHCVIGANAVVTHDIPDYSVAVGSPARVCRRYDADKQEWVAV